MAKKTKKTKPPHCKIRKNPDGSSKKSAAGKVLKTCFDGKGKITSEAAVKAYKKRTKSRKAA